MAEFLRSHAIALPTLAKFAIAMAIIVWRSPAVTPGQLPAVVGLLLSGIVIGPHGLDVIGTHRPIADFFADLGKLLLMFCAGLEIDLALFRRARNRVIAFGVLTTSATPAVGHWRWVSVRFPRQWPRLSWDLCSRRTHCSPLRRSQARRNPTRADRGYVRRDGGVGHAVSGGLRSLRFHLSTRLFRVRHWLCNSSRSRSLSHSFCLA